MLLGAPNSVVSCRLMNVGFVAAILGASLTGVGRSRRGTAGTWRPELPVKLGYLTL
jgi:hypothetical protein